MLFGTSGIRGILGRNITPKLAYLMGITFARFLGERPQVIVAHDVRLHSQVLYEQIILGLFEGGAQVVPAGRAPTPAVIHTQLELKYEGSVMVTGSHAIPSVTGLLFFLEDGGETDPEAQEKLQKLFPKALAMKKAEGKILESIDTLGIYSDKMIKGEYRLDGFKIVFDSGNGCMGGVASKLLTYLGANILSINEIQNGNFPGRSPYPRAETLSQLRKAVVETRSDLGVATDGDGDRAIFVTGDGEVLQGDITGSLLADEELSLRKGKIVAPLNSSNLVSDVCRFHNSMLITTKVGPPEIISAIRKDRDVIFGLEETGKYIWPSQLLYGDAIYSTIKMVSLLKRRNSSLRSEVDLLSKYYAEKRTVRCREEEKRTILQRAITYCRKYFPTGKFVLVDGIKVIFDDGSWLLLRPSGTEPFFRCYAESNSASKTKKLVSEGLKIISKAKA